MPDHPASAQGMTDTAVLYNPRGRQMANLKISCPLRHAMLKLGMPPRQDNLYFEQQEPGSYHCQVHAIDNVFGYCIITPEILKSFIDIQYRNDPSSVGWLYAYDANAGFSDNATGQWMLANNLCHTKVHTFVRTRKVCSTLDSLASQHGCDAFLCYNHNHAFAVK